jgi:hypothetical protein
VSGSVNLADVAAAVLEETATGGYRVRGTARRMVVGEPFRCPQGHLQAVVVRTVQGIAVVYRPADARKARDMWAEAWDSELPETIKVTCHCRRNDAIRWADAIS